MMQKRKKSYVFNLNAEGLYCTIKGTIKNQTLVEYLPCKSFRFYIFYVEYGGDLGETIFYEILKTH